MYNIYILTPFEQPSISIFVFVMSSGLVFVVFINSLIMEMYRKGAQIKKVWDNSPSCKPNYNLAVVLNETRKIKNDGYH